MACRVLFVVFTGILFFTNFVLAEIETENFYETGRLLQEEIIDDEDNSEFDYTSYGMNVKWNDTVANEDKWLFDYGLKTSVYEKDYSAKDDYDSTTRKYHLGLKAKDKGSGVKGQEIMPNEEFLIDLMESDKYRGKGVTIKTDIDYRQKRYSNRPLLEYDRTAIDMDLAFIERKDFKISTDFGLHRYEYINDATKDQTEFPIGIKATKYLFSDRVKADIGFKNTRVERKAPYKDKNRKDFAAGLDYKVDMPYFKTISLDFNRSESDTQYLEGWDENYDYTYRKYRLKSMHPVTEKIKTQITAAAFRKNYDTYDHDYTGYELANNTDFTLYKNDDRRFAAGIELGRKNTDYRDEESLDNNKNYASLELRYEHLKDFALKLKAGENIYHFRDNPSRERNSYFYNFGISKYFFNKKAVLGFNYRHKTEDFDNSPDLEHNVYEVSFKYIW